jgi:hypothetical protein
VDVEIWPTNVMVSPGGRLVFEIAGLTLRDVESSSMSTLKIGRVTYLLV